jgi:pSer/pThr/pTyr-binding forkhead associated (FHA) protein
VLQLKISHKNLWGLIKIITTEKYHMKSLKCSNKILIPKDNRKLVFMLETKKERERERENWQYEAQWKKVKLLTHGLELQYLLCIQKEKYITKDKRHRSVLRVWDS